MDFIEETIDEKSLTEFKPQRVNLIFKIPNEFRAEFKNTVNEKRIDCTYELQLRTVLSEGWHEIDHDLRYKSSQNWNDQNELSRVFNGILATLETSDWGIQNLFNQLSYNHYKSKDFESMMRTKYRIRFHGSTQLDSKLNEILEKDEDIVREYFKCDRSIIITSLAEKKIKFPLTLNNIVYYVNYAYVKNEDIAAITPEVLLKDFRGSL